MTRKELIEKVKEIQKLMQSLDFGPSGEGEAERELWPAHESIEQCLCTLEANEEAGI